MKITKANGTTILEISRKELNEHNLTFEEMNCSEVHTKEVINGFLSEALGEKSRMQKEILLLPDCNDGCVLVCREKPKSYSKNFFSSFISEKSEVFSSLFS